MALSAVDYTVACICPMGVELAPVEAMLDQIHDSPSHNRDQNAYTLGTIGVHNVVIAVLHETGTNAAAMVATQLLNDFPSIRFGLLVGIGGGVPGEVDIRLGDVVVSQATDTFGGVVQYDLGKRVGEGRFQRTGLLAKPPQILSASVRKLDSQHRRIGPQLSSLLSAMRSRYPHMATQYALPHDCDQLFLASYAHRSGTTCDDCDQAQTVHRLPRPDREPHVHYGTIGSANVVVKDAVLRDELQRDMRLLCIEMEAAGLMDSFPCLVIRGICDYADTHKNKVWQPYAAATAAAYMKELLSIIPAKETTRIAHAVDLAPNYKRGLNLFDAPNIDKYLFIGRESELGQMHDILTPNSGSIERKLLVLGGLGGVGKTQLAITFAKRHREQYSSTFWLNAASEATLLHSFRLVARRVLPTNVLSAVGLEHEQLRNAVLDWFSELDNSQWLLIFDNFDEPEAYQITDYYPFVSHGSILVTSRLPNRIVGEQIWMKPLTEVDDGLEILQRRSGRKNVHHDIYARRLAQRLDGLPLALVTAGMLLRKSVWNFEQYLQAYDRQWKVDSKQPVLVADYPDRTLNTTWNLSYVRLRQENADAARLLALLAYFDNQAIWYELFHAGIAVGDNAGGSGADDADADDDGQLPGWLLAIARDPDAFDGLMQVLVDYSFLEAQHESKTYNMHSCVHDWVMVGPKQSFEPWRYWFVLNCVAGSIGDEEIDTLGHSEFARLIPHAVRIANSTFGDTEEDFPLSRLRRVANVANLLQMQMQFDAARSLYERALATREKLLGTDHPSTLSMVDNLGILYETQCRLIDAERMYERALIGKEKLLGTEHTSTLDTVNNLGTLYYTQGRLKEAERMYERALAGTEKRLGTEHASTLETVNNLGTLYLTQGNLAEAERMFERALAGKEKVLGTEHTSTLDTVNNLGILYRTQGRLKEAERMFERALAGKEKVLGTEHASTLDTVNNLGILYWTQGRLAEAERMFERALAGKEKVLGTEHTSTLNTVYNLGNFYCIQGRLAEAERMYERALIGKEKVLGTEHTSTLDTVHNLGNLYYTQGRLKEAERMFERALAGKEKVLGTEHASTLDTVNNLGILYWTQGRLAEAERMFERALAGYEKAGGRDHSSTQRTMRNLTLLRAKISRKAEEKSELPSNDTVCHKDPAPGPTEPEASMATNDPHEQNKDNTGEGPRRRDLWKRLFSPKLSR